MAFRRSRDDEFGPWGRWRVWFALVLFLGMATGRADDTPADQLVAVWREVGAEQGIPEERLAEVTTILLDTLPLVRRQPDEAFVRQFRESLPEFVKVHVGRLRDPRKCEGTGRWLAFCVAEALDREPLTPEEEKECEAEYRALYEKFAEYLETRIREKIPAPVPEKVNKAVTAAMSAWTDAIMERTHKLQQDPLFPCLRAPLGKEALDSLTKRFQGAGRFPAWEVPFMLPPHLRHGSGPSPEEERETWFIRQTEMLARDSVGETLFWLTMAEIRPELRPCRYWGYVLYGATGGSGGSWWPVSATIGLNEEMNIQKGWVGPLRP